MASHHPSDQSDAGPASFQHSLQQQQQQQQQHHHRLHSSSIAQQSLQAALDTVDEDGDIGLMLPLDATDDDDDDDDVVSLDDGALTPTRSGYAALPSHITERFYRPSATRRRGSAASSRRNSISSVHSRCSSHHSHLSGLGGGPQSKYVAQHLRRASFLADRQARLADRAAHAEKVRLRAAVAKSSQARDASVSAERALAAQQARERNLAEIASTCAEEVKKAKAIAETMKEKREQELASLRVQIEERHAEAERRRREELRNRCTPKRTRAHSVAASTSTTGATTTSRTKSPPASARRALSPETAAGKISWWWAAMLRKRAVDEWVALGLVVDNVRKMTFDTVTQLLVENHVVRTAARVLRICGLQEGDAGSVAEMAAARVFLSAFLILGHPQAVFDDDKQSDRQTEQDLVAKARDQLISLENILSHLAPTNNYTAPPSQRKHLPEAYASFHNTFIAWKTRSKSAMIETMLMQFVELDSIWLTVKDIPNPDVHESYAEIKENQVQIIVRLKRLVGDRAMKMISDAVKKARKERGAAKKAQANQGDTKPRAVEEAAAEQAEVGGLPSPMMLSPGLSSSPMAPSSGSSMPTPAHASASSSSSSASAVDSNRPMAVASLGSLLPDNRVMVHELAIDDEYVIPTDEFREHQAMQQAALVMQMRVTADQSQEETFFEVFKLLARNIKDKLQRIVPAGGRMHGLMDDLFDLDVAERQFRVGSFSYDKYFGAVASILPQLCAPARDEQLRRLTEVGLQEGTLVDRAEALLGFVDTMLCDYVNHLLRQAAPGLIASSATYEARQFGDMVERHPGGEGALVAAETAWRSARSRVLAEASRRDPEGINHPRSRPTGDKIYYEMLVDIFTQPGAVSAATVPEMLQLDLSRVARVASMIHRIVTAGAILVQCKNLLKRDVRTPWRAEASRLIMVLESGQPAEAMLSGVMAALESGRSMPAVTREQLRSLAAKVLAASSNATTQEPREPVLRLLLGRLRGNLLARLTAGATSGSATQKVRETSSASEKMARIGLGEFMDKVREIVDEMGRVARVDRAAHAVWWERVAERVAAAEA